MEDLGLEMMDIVATPFIRVDEQMRTSCDRVFAVGDVNGLTLLDSAAVAQARVAVDTILGKNGPFFRSMDSAMYPYGSRGSFHRLERR